MTATPEEELTEAKKHFFSIHRHTDPFGTSLVTTYDSYDLYLLCTSDAFGNTTESRIDYRTLNPYLVIDVNGNRSQYVFDEMGFVVGITIKGKVTENIGDSLEGF